MRVRLATQIFSDSVAHGLRFCLRKGLDGFSGCEDTVEFCKHVNDMFDALNCKMPSGGFTPSSNDFKILETSLQWLNDWKRVVMKRDITADEFLTKETGNGLRLSLQSTMDLCRYLMQKYQFHYLLTGKVDQDNLETAGCNDHPSCSTFLQLYKLLSVYSAIKPPIYVNCSVVDNKAPEILVSVDDLLNIYGKRGSRTSAITKNFKAKLDEMGEYEEWEINDLREQDYSQPHVLDCIIYYATGLMGLIH